MRAWKAERVSRVTKLNSKNFPIPLNSWQRTDQKLEEALASDQVNDSRILQLQQIIADRASKKMEYDDTIVHQMIECVKVYPDGRLDIIFGGGYLIEERLEKEN